MGLPCTTTSTAPLTGSLRLPASAISDEAGWKHLKEAKPFYRVRRNTVLVVVSTSPRMQVEVEVRHVSAKQLA
jgi:hypothetical protein